MAVVVVDDHDDYAVVFFGILLFNHYLLFFIPQAKFRAEDKHPRGRKKERDREVHGGHHE